MIKTPDYLPETTTGLAESDVLGDALRALRLRGTLLLREAHRPPFRVAVPPAEELEAFLGVPCSARAVAFHLAEEGSFELRQENGERIAIESGDMVLGLGGEPHELLLGRSAQVVGFAELLGGASGRLLGPTPHREPELRQILCGALVFGDTRYNPLFSSLPKFLTLRRSGGENTGRVDQLVSMLLAEIAREEPASEYVVERLLEVLCAEGIRSYASECETAGWFRGIADAAIGRAMGAFHAAPGRRWSVADLAAAAFLSPSRFAARFVEVVGVPAMTYVTRWRMNVAMRILSETDRSITKLAAELGYESPEAFSRTFKRAVGSSPTQYRKKSRSA